jgi:iron complex outermembrane receptor protein
MQSTLFYKKVIISLGLSFALNLLCNAQERVTGEVRDGDGPLIGAHVVLKGTEKTAVTDTNGRFTLEFNANQNVLLISYIGYVTNEVMVLKDRPNPLVIFLKSDNPLTEVVVTSRRRREDVQDIPIPISVIGGSKISEAGAFNPNRLKELLPSVQLFASNARNTTLNIRGLGSTFGLTNDGIDPGVGYYVDGVYYARPAATALDFVDIDRVEVLRGPQGTLFGKNTTSGAFNVSTREPGFETNANFEASYGNLGFLQVKGSLTGPISKKLAARISLAGSQRDGTIYNMTTKLYMNDINNIGFRGQLLYKPIETIQIRFIGDITSQKPSGYGWPVAGVVTTKRAAFRQFNAILKDLNYSLPYTNAFERIVDHDTPSKADNELGGISINSDIKLGNGTLTSTTAWRYWKWDPLNDRDYTGLPAFTISAGNSKHNQFSHEIRYVGQINKHITSTVGVFGLWQDLNSDPVQTEEAGSAQWRFAQTNSSALWKTPGLFTNFGIKTINQIKSSSLAVFGQTDFRITSKIHIIPGIRYNYDLKKANYDRQVYGGLQTTDPALIALKNSVYTNQKFNINLSEDNFSGQATIQYKLVKKSNVFATYSLSYKPIGVNVGGLPTLNGEILTELAKVKPEYVNHFEIGLKSMPRENATINLTFFNTEIKDYQTQVQTPEPGVNRGYLANAEKVRVKGIELESKLILNKYLSFNGSMTMTEGKYVKFKNAPVPLEEVGGTLSFKDVSGGVLPGISKYAGTVGAESNTRGKFLSLAGDYFIAMDYFFRSSFSSSPSPSAYLNISGYSLLNGRAGFKASKGITLFVWSRNMLNKNYYEQLLVAPGSTGHYAGILGDPQTYGVTMKFIL